MRLELLTSIQSSQGWGGVNGNIVEVSDEEEARKLIKAGYARPAKDSTMETASAEPAKETTSGTPRRAKEGK